MITSLIKSKYNEILVSWGLIKFYGPISNGKSTLKEPTNYKNKQPIRISDINMVRGFN